MMAMAVVCLVRKCHVIAWFISDFFVEDADKPITVLQHSGSETMISVASMCGAHILIDLGAPLLAKLLVIFW